MNLKKCIGLFLAFFLLVSNLGLAFNVHYCGDKVASISLKPNFSSVKSDSCCGIVEKDSSCCQNKIVHFQEKSDNVVVKGFSFQYENPSIVIESKTSIPPLHYNSLDNYTPKYHCEVHPPTLYKLYSQYIFYDDFNV